VPIRQRLAKRHRYELTLRRFVALTLGPEDSDLAVDPLELLHEVWR